MKQASIINIARINASMSSVALAIAAAQANIFISIASNESPNPNEHITCARGHLDTAYHAADRLTETLSRKPASDPLSMDDFNIKDVGHKFMMAGLLSDIDSWNEVASSIEDNGFVAYLEDMKSNISAINKVFTSIDRKLTAWSRLDDSGRDNAVINNTAHNVIPLLAKLQAEMIKLQNFVQIGLLVYAELSYTDKGAGSLISHVTAGKMAAHANA